MTGFELRKEAAENVEGMGFGVVVKTAVNAPKENNHTNPYSEDLAIYTRLFIDVVRAGNNITMGVCYRSGFNGITDNVKVVSVQMAEDADTAKAVALAAELTRVTPIVSPTGSGFSVQLSDANQAADVLIALRNHRLDITSTTVEQPSLDEVFFALTGHTSEIPIPETEMSQP